MRARRIRGAAGESQPCNRVAGSVIRAYKTVRHHGWPTPQCGTAGGPPERWRTQSRPGVPLGGERAQTDRSPWPHRQRDPRAGRMTGHGGRVLVPWIVRSARAPSHASLLAVVDPVVVAVQEFDLLVEVAAQLGAVVALEGLELLDPAAQAGLLGLQVGQDVGALVLGLADHAVVLRLALGDQLVVQLLALVDQLVVLGLTGRDELVVLLLTLADQGVLPLVGLAHDTVAILLALADETLLGLLALGHVLVVQALGQRDDLGGVLALLVRRDGGSGRGSGRAEGARTGLGLRCAGLGVRHLALGLGGTALGLGDLLLQLAQATLGGVGLAAGVLNLLLQLPQLAVQAALQLLVGLGLGLGSLLTGGLHATVGVGLDLTDLGAPAVQLGRELLELGDELLALPAHLCQLLLVETGPTGEGGGTAVVAPVILARAAVLELGDQVVLVGQHPAQLDDDLVQEVVNLGLVITTPQVRRTEALLDDVLGGQRHGFTSLWRSAWSPTSRRAGATWH